MRYVKVPVHLMQTTLNVLGELPYVKVGDLVPHLMRLPMVEDAPPGPRAAPGPVPEPANEPVPIAADETKAG